MLKLETTNMVAGPITTNDVGLIIKENGDVKIFSTGGLAPQPDGTPLSPAQEAQGRKLMCLLLATQSEDIMRELEARLDEQLGRGFDFVEAGADDFDWLNKKGMH